MKKGWINRMLGLSLAIWFGGLSACAVSPSQPTELPQASEVASHDTNVGVAAEPELTAKSTSPPASLVEDLKIILAAELGLSSTEILVKEATAIEWTDQCLGAARPDEVCAQAITPGYRIVLATLTDSFEFHTDQTGRHFRRASTRK